jgi:ParB family chromosome partitioning protein
MNSRYEPFYRDIEEKFRNFFGTKVNINAGQRSGRIVIHYNTNDELSRIIELVK